MPITLQPNSLKYKDNNGVYQNIDGIKGDNAYIHIKYAATEPISDNDMKNIPDEWMGICSSNTTTAPSTYTSYTWYNIKGAPFLDFLLFFSL